MKYEKVKDFTKRSKSSKSTLYRFYKRNPEYWQETKLKNNKRLIPMVHARYFNSELMFDENKVLTQENQCMRNLIDCLMDKDSLAQTLWYMDWSFFVTIAYKSERNKISCFKMMNALNEELVKKYGDDTEIRIFFTTEPFTNRVGYHNHLALYVSNDKYHERVLEDIRAFFSYDRVDVGIYDKYQAGLFYMTKEGLVNEDWDILMNTKTDDEKLLSKLVA